MAVGANLAPINSVLSTVGYNTHHKGINIAHKIKSLLITFIYLRSKPCIFLGFLWCLI